MTVKELKARLKGVPEDTEVVLSMEGSWGYLHDLEFDTEDNSITLYNEF